MCVYFQNIDIIKCHTNFSANILHTFSMFILCFIFMFYFMLPFFLLDFLPTLTKAKKPTKVECDAGSIWLPYTSM